MSKQAIVLINLGTPDLPVIPAIKRYLKKFLMDKYVINLPALIRFILVYGFIVPLRSRRTTKAYQQIWTTQGSPLQIFSTQLAKKLEMHLNTPVKIAMRYGVPSIPQVLHELQKYDTLTILPLYPQYAPATTGSVMNEVLNFLQQQAFIPQLKIITNFYKHPAYIQALSTNIQNHLNPEYHLLLSYHGLPERQDSSSCYQQQCYTTSNAIAQTLQLSSAQYSTAFQSRLGTIPWIKPYTDETITQLAQNGIQKLAIACPSFITDCLETLEEINIQAKNQWKQLGGTDFQYIPCLNDQALWINALEQILCSS